MLLTTILHMPQSQMTNFKKYIFRKSNHNSNYICKCGLYRQFSVLRNVLLNVYTKYFLYVLFHKFCKTPESQMKKYFKTNTKGLSVLQFI